MIDARLSRDIEVGAIARPRYATDVIRTEGGFEFRVPRWRYPLFTFEFNIEPGDPTDANYQFESGETLGQFIDLWHAAGGMDETFLFRHWGDYQAVDNPIGLGDGSTLTFQLYRVYERGIVQRLRKITRPVFGTVTAKVDGVDAAIDVDPETGIITFGAAPALGAEITASFEFDLPVRFDDDALEVVALTAKLDQPVNIVLQEVRERSA